MTTASPPSRRALVLYGSETGNAQDVAEELGRLAERLRFDTDVAALNAVSLVCLIFPSIILLFCSHLPYGRRPLIRSFRM